MRGVNSDEFNDETEKITVETIIAMPLPDRKGVRDDVASLREAARAAAASAKLSRDKNRPTFDLFSTLSLNGRDPNFDPSFKESWRGNFPYTVVGLKFSTPLDFGSISKVNSGYELDKISTEYMYERKSFESDREWNDLTKKVNDMKERLKVAKELEDAQYKKYIYENNRLKLGRTTTYQVITFQQDYANAQYNRLSMQLQILESLATMKTFVGKEEQKI
jgi:outer membrane protein TolC